MMRLYFLLGFALMASACSRAGPARIPGSGREDLLLQAYNYGVDLAKREGANLRPCVGFERGRESTDPPVMVLAALRERDSRLLSHTQCEGMFRDLSSVHDTVLIAANLDSMATSPPRVGLRTWRSGLWGAGYLCSVRQTDSGWDLGACQLVWMS